jgi:hypothetical protein
MAARGHSRSSAQFARTGDLIAPEPPRDRRPHFRPVFADGAVIDAQFEMVDPVAEQAVRERPARAESNAAPARRLDLFGRKITFSVAEAPGRPSVFPVLLAGLCGLSFWVFGGHAVFARLAGTPMPDAPLEITDISTRLGIIDGMRVAIVNGRVVNVTGTRQKVPPISVSTDEAPGPVTVEPVTDVLEAGASTGFRARLPIAPGAEPEVAVAFADAVH